MRELGLRKVIFSVFGLVSAPAFASCWSVGRPGLVRSFFVVVCAVGSCRFFLSCSHCSVEFVLLSGCACFFSAGV